MNAKPIDAAANSAELTAIVERLDATVARFDATVSRLCVVMERQLSSSDQVSEKARKALEHLHPEMDAIRARVRRQIANTKR